MAKLTTKDINTIRDFLDSCLLDSEPEVKKVGDWKYSYDEDKLDKAVKVIRKYLPKRLK